MAASFRGGIRFSEVLCQAKREALHQPLQVFMPSVIRLPLQDGKTHFTPTVEPGATVRIGDLLAHDPTGAMPPLHSGLCGTVSIENASHLTIDGHPAPLITVHGNSQKTPATPLPSLSTSADAEAIVQRMYDGGLVGLGGAGFPTFRKYSGVTAHHLLINACECEPYLACDGRLAIEQTDTLREGIALMARACHVPSDGVRLCAESAVVARALHRIAETTSWTVIQLPERYPQGCEKQLIYAVLGIELPLGVYPSAWGILVSNVATAAAMADAARGLPLTHRAVTVSGAVKQPCNLFVPIGTPFRELVAQAEPLIVGNKTQWIVGGMMTGKRLVSTEAGLPKPCGGVLVLPTESQEETPCIRCGACVRTCPSGLMPYLIDQAWLHQDEALCADLKATACISCGCCSRVCPARRQLAARITQVRRKGECR